MATAFQSGFLGILQGLTEFIPVSSSGHLYLLPQLFGWEAPSTIFILAVHLGTLIALIFYFRKLLWQYALSLLILIRLRRSKDSKQDSTNNKAVLMILIATIPAAAIGVLAEDLISNFYDSESTTELATQVTLAAMALLGVVFIFSEKLFTGKKISREKLGVLGAIGIGASQALAFIRGVSRSGITLISGQLFGLSRVAAAEFSFLMSIPIMIGTSGLGIYKLTQLPTDQLESELGIAAIGLITALISGYLAIKFMLNYLKNNNLSGFGWYRIAFAVIVFLLLFV